ELGQPSQTLDTVWLTSHAVPQPREAEMSEQFGYATQFPEVLRRFALFAIALAGRADAGCTTGRRGSIWRIR
ncbi:MAG TPA: hypothetical protein VGO23_18730, partial [Pseudonocardia sp.]|nr:hypothetical protein [Pseudonocardia sp.]